MTFKQYEDQLYRFAAERARIDIDRLKEEGNYIYGDEYGIAFNKHLRWYYQKYPYHARYPKIVKNRKNAKV